VLIITLGFVIFSAGNLLKKKKHIKFQLSQKPGQPLKLGPFYLGWKINSVTLVFSEWGSKEGQKLFRSGSQHQAAIREGSQLSN